jgi:hypothetical protein
VINLTPGGSCLETGYLLREQSDGWLHLPSLADWESQVIWSRGSQHGLAFAKPFHDAVMAMLFDRANGNGAAMRPNRAYMHESRAPHPWRVSRREQILSGKKAVLTLRGKREQAVVIKLSTNTLTLKSPVRPFIGEAIAVEMPGVDPVEGTVAWWQDGRLGIQLESA